VSEGAVQAFRAAHLSADIESQPMRRLCFLLLLFVLPFQMVWGAAAPYCAHETQPSASKHFGHHEHQHQASDAAPAAAAEDGTVPASAYDVDCAVCHLGSVVMPLNGTLPIASVPPGTFHSDPGPGYRSYIPAGLDRPDRALPTSAARFVGGVAIG